MRVTALLVALLSAWAGCASAPAALPAASQDSAARSTGLEEQFDPETLQEDLLLIDPAFPQPAVGAEPAVPTPTPAAAAPQVPAPGFRPEPEAAAAAAGPWLYRVQIMALSTPEAAAQLRDRLQSELEVPARVDQERGRYQVRVGAFGTETEAHRFAEDLATAHPEHADAYVVHVPADTTAVDSTGAALMDSLAPPPPVNQVPAFGWRILLDQYLTHDQAEAARRKAVERLGRTDIDITFKAPWYKVEVGNFRSEGHAQDAFQNLKRRYPNALLVRSQILVPAEE